LIASLLPEKYLTCFYKKSFSRRLPDHLRFFTSGKIAFPEIIIGYAAGNNRQAGKIHKNACNETQW
jgi:hypothetical protein